MGYKVNKRYVGTKQVRPELQLQKIFDFSTSDLHGFTNYIAAGAGLVIDTTNHWCTRGNSNWSNGGIYKNVNYSYCHQRIKGNFNYIGNDGGLMVGLGGGLGGVSNQTFLFFGSQLEGGTPILRANKNEGTTSSRQTYTIPSWWSRNTDYYYDMIFDNGILTIKVLDMNFNELFSEELSTSLTRITKIGFSMYSGTTSGGAAYIKEYRLAYEE